MTSVRLFKYLTVGVSALALSSTLSFGALAQDMGMTASASGEMVAKDPMQISLSEAVAIGVRTNPEYNIVANNRRATDEELNQAKALYLPSIDVAADTGFEHSDDPSTRGGLDDDDEENMWRYEAGITLTQMLFDGFETKHEVGRQKPALNPHPTAYAKHPN